MNISGVVSRTRIEYGVCVYLLLTSAKLTLQTIQMNDKAFTVITHHAMMTSSNGNIFRVTGPLCGEFTGPGLVLARLKQCWLVY